MILALFFFLFSINVKFVAGDGCAKYVVKYAMKGADMAIVNVQREVDGKLQNEVDYDEFNQMRLARYVTSPEAFLSLWSEPLVGKSHTVIIYTFKLTVIIFSG